MMFQAELAKYEGDPEISILSQSLKQKFIPMTNAVA